MSVTAPPAIAITERELLEALVVASEAPEDARTAAEMADAAGLDVRIVQAALRKLHRQGRLVPHRVRRTGIDGRNALVPAYTIRPAA